MSMMAYSHPAFWLIDPARPDMTQLLIGLIGAGALQMKPLQPRTHVYPKRPRTAGDAKQIDLANERRQRRHDTARRNALKCGARCDMPAEFHVAAGLDAHAKTTIVEIPAPKVYTEADIHRLQWIMAHVPKDKRFHIKYLKADLDATHTQRRGVKMPKGYMPADAGQLLSAA